jgi:hypothetical protein
VMYRFYEQIDILYVIIKKEKKEKEKEKDFDKITNKN